MRHFSRHISIATLWLVVGTAFTARADIVFNNFGAGDAFSDSGRLLQGESVGTIANVDQAVAFVVGANSYKLTSISLGIFADTSPNVGTGPLNVVLASDSGGLPGASLANQVLNVNTTGKQVVTATFGGSTQLNANTTYWVIADAQTTFDGSWNFNSIGDKGNTAGRSNNGPWDLRVNDDRMALRVQGTLVPEPASLAVIAGMLGLILRRPRR
jgi:hypothetical protein